MKFSMKSLKYQMMILKDLASKINQIKIRVNRMWKMKPEEKPLSETEWVCQNRNALNFMIYSDLDSSYCNGNFDVKLKFNLYIL